MFDLPAISNLLCALGFAWLVWTGFSSGRAFGVGPDRRHTPVSFWLVQLVFCGMALLFVGGVALRVWAFAVVDG